VKYMLSVRIILARMTGVILAISSGLAISRRARHTHRRRSRRFDQSTDQPTDGVVDGGEVPFDGVVKANVVMMGATAGFASTFRSPVGGMLYCVEALASHWNIESHMMT
jgi:hypothetical protein